MIVRYILFFVFLNHEDISCGHGTHMNESWYTYEWVMANTWWSVSCHTYDTGTANTWLSSHATCMNESLNTWLTQSRDTLLHVCAMTHSYVYHDSFIGRGHVKRMIASIVCSRGHATYINESWYTNDSVTPHICMRHVKHNLQMQPRPTYKRDLAHIELHHTYHTDTAHSWKSDTFLFTRMTTSWHTNEWVVSHTWISHVTHMHESCHTYKWVVSHIWINRSVHTATDQHYGVATISRLLKL